MSYRVTIKGTKEARKLLNELSDRELQNRTRRGTRAGAKVLRTAYRAEVRGRSDVPRSFRRTRTRNHRSPLGTSTGPSSPLINIFEVGAKAHAIGKPGQVLTNPAAGFFARGPVAHPGMSARPTIEPVFEREQDDASDATLEAILEGLK
jgi:hypothetical protein